MAEASMPACAFAYAFLAESLTCLVKIMEYRTNRLFFLLAIIMNHRLPYRFLFGDTRFETMLGKADQERNAQKDTRPSAKLSYARVSVQKASFVLDAIRGKDVKDSDPKLKRVFPIFVEGDEDEGEKPY